MLSPQDRKWERVITFLRKYTCVTKTKLQQSVSSYGIWRDELNFMLRTLEDQQRIRRFSTGRVHKIEWIGRR
jgi:hypothetical protein